MANTLNLDRLIDRLTENRFIEFGYDPVNITESEAIELCESVEDILLEQPSLLELDVPIKICGDTRGRFVGLLSLFDFIGSPADKNYLFLGNYIDDYVESFETICLLFAYKIKYKETFFLLRGNNETEEMCKSLGFYREIKHRFNRKISKMFIDCFNCLPFAAIVADSIFCCHAGLSPYLKSLMQLVEIERPTEVTEKGLTNDLLWSKPDDQIRGWNDTEHDTYRFGIDIVKKFLRKHNLELVICSNEICSKGFKYFPKNQLLLLFSVAYYTVEDKNCGAVLDVDEERFCTLEVMIGSDNIMADGMEYDTEHRQCISNSFTDDGIHNDDVSPDDDVNPDDDDDVDTGWESNPSAAGGSSDEIND